MAVGEDCYHAMAAGAIGRGDYQNPDPSEDGYRQRAFGRGCPQGLAGRQWGEQIP